ncbi:hypothetical protein GS597_18155 [Synechococcales cyanobacterium C]|uniref:Cellulose-binding domain protein n=1 Tax=Petrachloros mirabilis ULC683 TaxID=2781853 RepID=A0A8K2A9N9_9CYAN|nr:hypothetical protein [Petrachloros mirabilis]NCJ08395.1 hypothetical protein [Petrachloros mirabilis ULC683]
MVRIPQQRPAVTRCQHRRLVLSWRASTRRWIWGGLLGILLVTTLSALPWIQGSIAQPTRAPVGMNLGGVVSYSTAWPFTDAFKMSHPWYSQRRGAGFNQGEPIQLTETGWVAALRPEHTVDTVIFNGQHGRYPAGQYTLLYEGEGQIQATLNTATVVSQQPGRMVLNVVPQSNGLWFKLARVNPQNPIRNIRLILPGFEQTYARQTFHPLFLERLRPFSHTIRFMNWLRTNNSELVNWSQRSTLEMPTQGNSQGVALEYMIELANTLKANPWFTMPHQASDAYVRQFAQLVRDRLDPSLKVHVEYSNEVWNNIFSQSRYAQEQGLAMGLSNDPMEARLRFYAQRSVEVFKIWESVFGGTDRLVRILAGQSANPWTGRQILEWRDAYKQADAYAIAPYFGSSLEKLEPQAQLQMPINAAMDILDQEVSELGQTLRTNYSWVRDLGLDLIAYEGGQHLVSGRFGEREPQMRERYLQVNRHPRMRQIYFKYLQQWQQAGGGLFCHFADIYWPGRHGFWGALEYQDQDLQTAPKYLGLLDFVRSTQAQEAPTDVPTNANDGAEDLASTPEISIQPLSIGSNTPALISLITGVSVGTLLITLWVKQRRNV